MVATFSLTSDKFPNGTSVGAYPVTNWVFAQLPPSGAAPGSATATASVSSGTASFTGLADDTEYYFGASVSGTWRYVKGRTPPASADSSASPIGQRLINLLARDDADQALAAVTDSVGAENTATPDPHEWVYKLGQRVAAKFPKYTVRFYSWDWVAFKYRDPVTIQTGTGIHVLSIWGAGQPGHYLPEAEKYLDSMVAAPLLQDGSTRASPPGLVLVAEGHNASQGAYDLKRAQILSFSNLVTQALPAVEVVLIAQNPETNDVPQITVTATGGSMTVTVNAHSPFTITVGDSAATVQTAARAAGCDVSVFGGPGSDRPKYALVFAGADKFPTINLNTAGLTGGTATVTNFTTGMYDWSRACRSVSDQCGYGFVDVYAAFQAAETFPGELTQTPGGTVPDGTHPNDAGYELWADTVWEQMQPASGAFQPRSQQPSSYSQPVENLLANGDFTQFAAGSAPADWTASNVTLTKDFTNYEGLKGYSVRGVPAAAGSRASVSQTITGDRLKRLLGKWLTVAARIRNNGTDTQTGLPQILVTSISGGNPSVMPSVSDEGLAVWRWNTVSIRVPADTTAVEIRHYFDFGTDGGGDSSLDRIVLAEGLLPRDIIPSEVDPLGRASFDYNAGTLAATIADGGTVASWPDAAGRQPALTQATGANQPTLQHTAHNGLPAVRFDGTNDRLQAAFTRARPFTLFVIAKRAASGGAAAPVLLDGYDSGAGRVSWPDATHVTISSTGTFDPEDDGTLGVVTTPTDWHVYCFIFEAVAGQIQIDGGAVERDTNIGGSVPTGITVGTTSGGTTAAAADVARLVGFDGVLTAAEIADVFAALGA